MRNQTNTVILEQQPPSPFFTFDFMEIDISIHLLEIVIKVGKYFPIILLSLASLNLVLAANDFLANSLLFAVINSIFAIGNFVSLAQVFQKRKSWLNEYDSNYSKFSSLFVMDMGNELK